MLRDTLRHELTTLPTLGDLAGFAVLALVAVLIFI